MELMQANHQWSTRPDDERFLSLDHLFEHCKNERNHSAEKIVSSRSIEVAPVENDHKGLVITGKAGVAYAPTHWAFGQLAARAGAPAGYLRDLPSPLAADCMNYGLKIRSDIQDIGLLLYKNGGPGMLKAATGPNYGRVWNDSVVHAMRTQFGNGVDGTWHIPGEFNAKAPITKENTTLYASDRDMWTFLCDGEHDIEIPNRRFGQSGKMQRGFFMWNSQVGDRTLGFGTFLFDYMCCNHIIWGAAGFEEIRIRHTSGAPDRFIEEIVPALKSYANGSAKGVTDAIAKAREARIEKVDDFLANRFGRGMVGKLQAVHMLEEQRPIETVWDVSNAVTAYAKGLPFIGPRVDLEREAGKILLAA